MIYRIGLMILTVGILGTMTAIAAERFAIPYLPNKDLTHQQQTLSIADIQIEIDMTRPAEPFQKLVFSILFKQNAGGISVQNPGIRFNMKMDMGPYYAAGVLQKGRYQVEIILPKCMWGDNRWFGRIEFEHQGQQFTEVFFFDIAR